MFSPSKWPPGIKFCERENLFTMGSKYTFFTGKSLSEVVIYLSINPQYDKRLSNDLQVQYEKIPRAEHVKNMSRTCYVFTQIVLNV